MKHKLSALLLALVMAAAVAMPAFADVMWAPYDNSFYETHWDECTYENRSYLANGQKGYITLRIAPDSVIEVANVPNGVSLYIGYTWQEDVGDKWAVGEYGVLNEDGNRTWYTGWVKLSDLALIYDYIAFEEDHGAEFQEYDGSGDELSEVCLYSYPGGVCWEYTLEENKGYMPFSETFQHLYTDENGLRWTFVGYYMGRNNAWACLDDPLNANLGTETPLTVGQVRGAGDVIPPAEEVPGPVTSEAASDFQEPSVPAKDDAAPSEELIPPAEEVPAAKTWIVWLIPAVLVVAVVVMTAVLVRKKHKKA